MYADQEDLNYAVADFEKGTRFFGFESDEEQTAVEGRMGRMVAGLDRLFI